MTTKLYNPEKQKYIRRKLRKTMPKGEILLWKRLQRKNAGYRFRRQYSIGKYVVDFYCPKLKLVIEIDGLTHDFLDQTKLDHQRQKYLESIGMRAKRFYSSDVFEDLDNVVQQIIYLCEKLNKKK